MRLAVLVVLFACGGSDPKQQTVPSEAFDSKVTPDAAQAKPAPATTTLNATAEQACASFAQLSGSSCDWTQRFPPAFATQCLATVESWLAPTKPERDEMQRTINCWSRSCDEAAECMVNARLEAGPPPARTCGEEGTAPILVDDVAWKNRRGVSTAKFSQFKTTQQLPLQVCGIPGELDWLTRVACDDGTRPYKTQEEALDRRDAWIGRGGDCNSVLDRFTVPCKEAIYTIYIDRYFCPQSGR